MTNQDDLDPMDDALAVAIIGLSGRFPGAANVDELWSNLGSDVPGIRQFSREELIAAGIDHATLMDAHYVKAAAMLDDADRFDAAFFGVTPREAEITDPQQRVFLELCWHAMEDAGYGPGSFGTDLAVGVYAGASHNSYFLQNMLGNAALVQSVGTAALSFANDGDFLCTRVAYHLDLRGPAVVIQSACSTSLVAVHMASQALIGQECDIALAGGVSIGQFSKAGYRYDKDGIGSPDGHCRAFDAQAAGTVHGNGAGVVVLKRLSEARRDGDTIHAVIRGSAINNDGANKVGFSAPSVTGQVDVISQALAAAGVEADSISYVEAHGTGTALGDPIEVKALQAVFGRSSSRRQFCTLGSIKPSIGHLDAAAGVAGLIKTVMALKHRQLPGVLDFESANPLLELEASAFYIQRGMRDWPDGPTPRRAGVSSLGIGGTNAHVVLEEAVAAAPSKSRRAAHLILLSARNEEALQQAREDLRDHLARNPTADLADTAYTTQVGRAAFSHRSALVCNGVDQALALLSSQPASWSTARAEADPRVVLMFPGQGVQYANMARDIYADEPVFRAVVDRCSESLRGVLGRDLRDLLFPTCGGEADAEDALQRTCFTQPALFVIEYALSQLLASWGVRPDALMGHSLGEYVAACVAGVFTLDDALMLVAERGRLIDSLAGGAMLAVNASEAELVPLLSEGSWLAAVNGPARCTVSGAQASIARLAAQLTSLHIASQPLHTRHAFHSGLLDPILPAFSTYLQRVRFSPPTLPFTSNVTGTWITDEQAMSPTYWLAHLRQTVRFSDNVRAVSEQGPALLVEAGPGQVLTQIVRQHANREDTFNAVGALPDRRSARPAQEVLLEALGRLWTNGVRIDWNAYHQDERRRRVGLPGYPFQRQRYWVAAAGTRIAAMAVTRGATPVEDWFYGLAWKQDRAPEPPPRECVHDSVHVVFEDEGGLCIPFIEAELAAGARVVRVRSGTGFRERSAEQFVIDGSEPEDYVRLLERVTERGTPPPRVSHFWCVTGGASAPDNEQQGFGSLIFLAQALARQAQAGATQLNVFATGVHSVTGSEALASHRSTMLGPCRVIPLEYPHLSCRFIDIELRPEGDIDPRLWPRLRGEAWLSGNATSIAYRGVRRWVHSVEQAAPHSTGVRIADGQHYLITGGLGGIGLAFAEYVCSRASSPQLTLTGRTRLPDPADWARCLEEGDEATRTALGRLAALQKRGAQVHYVTSDVACPQDVERLAASAHAHFGPVNGIFHAAGLPGDALIHDKTLAAARRVMASKLEGTPLVSAAFACDPLDFHVLCSSLNALQPAPGQVDYCAANAFLDAWAAQQHALGNTAVMAVNWPAWRDTGMAARAREQGVAGLRAVQPFAPADAIALADADAVFDQMLAHVGTPQILVSPASLLTSAAAAAPTTVAEVAAAGIDDMGRRHPRPALASTFVAPRSAVEVTLAGLWADLFGIDPVGIQDDFLDLGGHSLLAVQLVSRLRQALNVELSLDVLFANPTIERLAAYIEQQLPTDSHAIAAVPRGEPLPLSWAQQRLWFVEQLGVAASASYHMPTALRLQGELNTTALQSTLDRIVARHEGLRARFLQTEAGPVQQFDRADIGFSLHHVDLTGCAADARAAAVQSISAEEARAPFDLRHGPLIRGQLLRLSPHEHVLLVTQHHIVSDGWSVGVLISEFSALYAAYCKHAPDPLPPLPVQYADYAAWQRQRLQGDLLRRQIDYWCGQLAGAPPLLDLPTDRPRPAVQSYAGDSVSFELPSELTGALRALSRRHGTTLFMTLLSGWALLMSRLSGQETVVVGTPVANRERPETEGLIGCLVNTLALRLDVAEAPTIAALLAQVKATALSAYAHQEVPFEQVVDAVQPPRNVGHTPLFQVMLVLNESQDSAPRGLPGLTLHPVEATIQAARTDLVLVFSDTGERLAGTLEFASDLFDRSTIQRWAAHLITLLEAMTTVEDAVPAELPMLSADETRALLAVSSEAIYPDEALIHGTFEAHAARTPAAVALVDGELSITYGELNHRANQVAHALQARGVVAGTLVAVCAERGTDMVIAMLGILKAGGAYLPLDPSSPAERRAQMLQDAQPALILTQAALLQQEEDGPSTPVLLIEDEAMAAMATCNPTVDGLTSRGLAYVIYTSGSTGMPKGVMVEHRHVARLLKATEVSFGFRADDVWSLFHSIAFDFSVWELWGALAYGGRVVVVTTECARSPHAFYALLCRHRVTVLNQTPGAFRALIQVQAEHDMEHALRVVIFGGDTLQSTMLLPWVERNPLHRTRLVNMYGITETTVHTTFHELTAQDIASSARVIGHPLGDLRIHVLDGNRRPVPAGVVGEMYVGGAGVTRGYLNRPELTAERFIQDPFSRDASARLYRTGDLARRRVDGTLDYMGRNDSQVKLRGYRIELGEIETRLAACDGVREAIVLLSEDAAGLKQLVAYVIPESDLPPSAAVLRTQLSCVLADHMVPAAFVVVTAWPLTRNGKLDLRALPLPDRDALMAHAFVAPEGDMELALCRIWESVLHIDAVGRHDNFFELGGDSIRSIEIIAAAKRIGIDVSVIDLFRHASVAALATVARSAGRQPGVAHEAVNATDAADGTSSNPLSTIEAATRVTLLQRGMVFHNQFATGEGIYHDVFSYRLRMPTWDEPTFIDALRDIVNRHPVLRSSFEYGDDGEALQKVYREVIAPLQVFDLSGRPAAEQQARIAAFMAEERLIPFDLATPPLFRVFIHRLDAHDVQYTLSFHHALMDGWSVALMQTELFSFYLSRLEGGKVQDGLPEANFAALSAATEAEVLGSRRHREFWQQQLDGHEPSALPRNVTEPDRDRAAVARRFTVDAQTRAGIGALARRLKVPVRSVLLSVHMKVLGLWMGAADVVSGLVCNVRPEQEGAEQALGLFLNTLPFRLGLERMSWSSLVLETHARELDVLEHRHYPYFQIYMDHGRRRMFEAAFNYVNFRPYEQLAGTGIEVLEACNLEATDFPLTVTFTDTLDELAVILDAGPDTMTAAQLVCMAAHYQNVIQALVLSPDADHCAATLLGPSEHARIVTGFNDTARPFARESLVHAGFEAQVGERPLATAVEFAGQALSYADLNRRANRMAHRLMEHGVGRGDRVALCLERGLDMVVAVLGVLKSGAAYVPLDHAYPTERLVYMLDDSDPSVLVTQAGFMAESATSRITTLFCDSEGFFTGTGPDHDPDPGLTGACADDLAYVIYTSGSTGRPKGVMVQHRPVVNLIDWVNREFDVGPEDRLLFTTSLCFDLSVYDILGVLAAGGTIRVAAKDDVADPRRLLDILHDERITFWDSAPAVFGQLLPWLATDRPGNTYLRLAFFSGDWIPLELPAAVRAAFPACQVVALGGATEATVWSNAYRVDAVAPGWTSVPYGKPIQNARYHVLDAGLQPCPVGVAGDLYIGGDCLSLGYFRREQLTAERYLPDPFSEEPGSRIYKTGDRARYWADGNLEFLGRQDSQVKIRGFRIELGEVEVRLATCEGVSEALVVAFGEGRTEKRLVAYVIGRDGARISAAGLRESLGAVLPEYMVPSAYIQLEVWPLTPNGKIDRNALPPPDGTATAMRAYEAPVGAAEEGLAQIWSALLDVPRIGRHDGFFDLGGHSLLAIQLSERVRQTFGVELQLATLFDDSRLESMAASIVRAQLEASGEDVQRMEQELESMTEAELLAILGMENSNEDA
ncbi:amino acid adenylation domain-containing protein [Xanthomonas euroxanthea]|uniref:Phenolphthiocerol/phthiocerol polyketide synthase subunit E n=1 Tax=Xanthomonas euroxanthea TaxID=2259622 RepID=A0A8E4DZM6_9XANT|nr:non-ribosomal peptide synthetase/type I polyketide synthase [Xanthomonas euroxanthea]CAD1792148.1 amino acid adenylation domain-containing protein [Xanthomonas euroxanthea]